MKFLVCRFDIAVNANVKKAKQCKAADGNTDGSNLDYGLYCSIS